MPTDLIPVNILRHAHVALASLLENHTAFVKLLRDHIEDQVRWPEEDKSEDQLQANYRPDKDRIFGDKAAYISRSTTVGGADSFHSAHSSSSLKRPREDSTDFDTTRREGLGELRQSRRLRREDPI